MAADAPREDVVAGLLDAGCVVVERLVSTAVTRAVREEISSALEHVEATPKRAPDTYSGASIDYYTSDTRRLGGVLGHSAAFGQLAQHPTVLGVCDAVLLPHCSRYQVHATGAFVVGPGANDQGLHTEEGPFRHFPSPPPDLVVASMWALSEFTAENGATHFVPGSHRADSSGDGVVEQAAMPEGSVVLWLGRTRHGAAANRSSQWRYGGFTSYSLGWLRQEENQYLSVPQDVAAGLSPALRDLMGYAIHEPTLGYSSFAQFG